MDDRCDLLCLDLEAAEAIRARSLEVGVVRQVARRARALADPTRLQLAAALSEAGELCVCDLAWIVGRSQNLVSHHLKTLRRGGLVGSRRDGKMVLYSLSDDGRRLLAAMLRPASAVSA
ncbi:MAG TPA: metalloregulator ArsR/SmtB family transcription factor [Gaiellaceae bacterium]|nr:metalloregulator ArsR/SmtB family transcription factor [Gaiellaceae bacterium]